MEIDIFHKLYAKNHPIKDLAFQKQSLTEYVLDNNFSDIRYKINHNETNVEPLKRLYSPKSELSRKSLSHQNETIVDFFDKNKFLRERNASSFNFPSISNSPISDFDLVPLTPHSSLSDDKNSKFLVSTPLTIIKIPSAKFLNFQNVPINEYQMKKFPYFSRNTSTSTHSNPSNNSIEGKPEFPLKVMSFLNEKSFEQTFKTQDSKNAKPVSDLVSKDKLNLASKIDNQSSDIKNQKYVSTIKSNGLGNKNIANTAQSDKMDLETSNDSRKNQNTQTNRDDIENQKSIESNEKETKGSSHSNSKRRKRKIIFLFLSCICLLLSLLIGLMIGLIIFFGVTTQTKYQYFTNTIFQSAFTESITALTTITNSGTTTLTSSATITNTITSTSTKSSTSTSTGTSTTKTTTSQTPACFTSADCSGSSVVGTSGTYVTMTCSNNQCICLAPYQEVIFSPIYRCVLPNGQIAFSCTEDVQCENRCNGGKCVA